MSKKSDLGKKLGELAIKLVDQALIEGVALEIRLDILKTAGNFHLGNAKVSAKKKDEDPSDSTFADIKDAISNLNSGDAQHA